MTNAASAVDRVVLGLLTVASPLLLVCLLVGHPLTQLCFSAVGLGFPIALMALGVRRNGRLGPLAIPLSALLLILEVGLVLLLNLEGRSGSLPWILGLPVGMAVQIYLMTLVPLAITTAFYAQTFETFTLTSADLERVRSASIGSSPPPQESEE